MRVNNRKGIDVQLAVTFIIISIIPIFLVHIVYYYNTSRLVQQNVESMTRANLEQTRVSLDVWLDSYEDILFQVYTDDNIVELVDRINAGEDVAGNRKMLRKMLRGLFYTKDYVKSISIITESGELVFYDQLTASTTQTSWLDSMELSEEELYEEISGDNRTHLFSTGERMVFGSNSCNLFHIGHRIIDYRDVKKQCGVVIVSIDEKLLEEVCSAPTENGLNFIVDGEGHLVSCANSGEIGSSIFVEGADESERRAAYQQAAAGTGLLGDGELSVYSVHDEKTGWEIIRATNQNELVQGLHQQQKILAFIIFLSLLSVLPMMDKYKKSVEKQKNAEIAALEAQINPHFLYNMMDVINWMVLQGKSQEASSVIQILARFYKLTLSRKQKMSTIREELEHVNIYMQLQNMRYPNCFEFVADMPDELSNYQIPKLTLQPIIENSILHGILESDSKTGTIVVTGWQEDSDICILVSDDGVGMSADALSNILSGQENHHTKGSNIAVYNIHNRLQLLYGENYGLHYESTEGNGCEVTLRIPMQKE